jgi:hypothetical protein
MGRQRRPLQFDGFFRGVREMILSDSPGASAESADN